MSDKINDGGRAFPHHETTSTGEPYHDHLGMSLRAWLAGQALTGLMMAKPDESDAKLAEWSVNAADAVIHALGESK